MTNNDIRLNFSSNLRILRQNKGLTLERLSLMSDISCYRLSKLERHLIMPTLLDAIKLADVLNLSIEQFITPRIDDMWLADVEKIDKKIKSHIDRISLFQKLDLLNFLKNLPQHNN